MLEERPIDGTLENFVTQNNKDRDVLYRKAVMEIHPEYMVIAQGRQPDGFKGGVFYFLLGALIFGLTALGMKRGWAKPPAQPRTSVDDRPD